MKNQQWYKSGTRRYLADFSKTGRKKIGRYKSDVPRSLFKKYEKKTTRFKCRTFGKVAKSLSGESYPFGANFFRTVQKPVLILDFSEVPESVPKWCPPIACQKVPKKKLPDLSVAPSAYVRKRCSGESPLPDASPLAQTVRGELFTSTQKKISSREKKNLD